MHLDVSRDSFDPDGRLLRVVQEQGGLLLDADANEQTAILLHRLHTLATDLFGPAWGPAEGAGFGVTWENVKKQYDISPGRYYVGGRACEIAAGYTLADQPDARAAVPIAVPDADPFLFYLDVWERALPAAANVTGRDPGLEGMRPAPRTQLVCQVRVFPDAKSKYDAPYVPLAERVKVLHPAGATGPAVAGGIKDSAARQIVFADRDPAATGALRARPIAHPDDTADPVELENQLYRVEIHRGGAAVKAGQQPPPGGAYATYKWSRENGAVCFPVAEVVAWGGTTATLRLTDGFRDDRFALRPGDWVEYADDVTVLRPRAADAGGMIPNLFWVESVSDDLPVEVTLKAAVAGEYAPDTETNTPLAPVLIRWDNPANSRGDPAGRPPPRRGAIRADDDALVVFTTPDGKPSKRDDDWLPLEAGVAVQFVAGDGQTFGRGDYWLIPARAATGAVVWPADKTDPTQPRAEPPRDTPHFFAPLAAAAKKDEDPVDQRRIMKPARLKELFT